MTGGFIHQQDKTILNMYIPTNKALTVIELKGKIYKATEVGNFQHTFLSNWQNFKSQQGFEHYKPPDLIDTLFHPITTKYTLFSSVPETFTNMNHILDHLRKTKRNTITWEQGRGKKKLPEFKRTEILQRMFSNCKRIKLERCTSKYISHGSSRL